jgi:hypothetical protein
MRPSHGFLLALGVVNAGCFAPRRMLEPIPITQLEIRAIQTRTYAGQDTKTVLKTVLSVLQDDGFLVHFGDVELGLLDASKSVAGLDGGDFGVAFQPRIAAEIVGDTPGVATIEATANVSDYGNQVSVRVNFQRRLVDPKGRVSVTQVTDAKGYQEFFAKLDKGLFLQRQGL